MDHYPEIDEKAKGHLPLVSGRANRNVPQGSAYRIEVDNPESLTQKPTSA